MSPRRRPDRSRGGGREHGTDNNNLGSIPENDAVSTISTTTPTRTRIPDHQHHHDHDDIDDARGREEDPGGHHSASFSVTSSGAQTASVTIPERRTGTADTDSDDSERWELTWPIWHMLPRSERKEIATKHGMRSIGEFEEYMSLQRAMGAGGNGVDEYVTLRPEEEPPQPEPAVAAPDEETDDEEDDAVDHHLRGTSPARVEPPPDESSSAVAEEGGTSLHPAKDGTTDLDDDSDHPPPLGGGLIATLPEEVQHHILSYLPIERYLTAALVHPSWSVFTRTEHAYRILCRRAYLNQSRRKHLNISRWNGSYRYMLTHRPRVRTHGGLYVLKFARVKKIQRDMWTEIPVGAVLETVYYRYLYFHECGGGTVMYALTPSPPHEMIPRFHRRRLMGANPGGGGGGGGDERIVEGRYEVRRDEVNVWAEHSWCHVLMQMKILTSGTEGAWGKFTGLKFERHRTSDTGKFDVEEDGYGNVVSNRNGVVEYDVPDELFRFVRDDRL